MREQTEAGEIVPRKNHVQRGTRSCPDCRSGILELYVTLMHKNGYYDAQQGVGKYRLATYYEVSSARQAMIHTR